MNSCNIVIANNEFEALVALTYDEQAMGLMYRDPPLPAMVFPYPTPRVNKFWMQNTKQALDIIFCLDNKIISICRGVPYSTALIGEDRPSDLVIELPAGTCEAQGIKVGDSVRPQYSVDSLMKLFMMKNGLQI